MSSVEAARPFVEAPVVEVVPSDVAPVEQPTFNSVGIDAHSNVIRVRPSLNEMSPIEVIELSRPYVAMLLAAIGVVILLTLSVTLYRRYRRENFAQPSSEALDRRSVRRRQATAARSSTT